MAFTKPQKSRIVDAASDNGYFDVYWRLHDVKVSQPENKADINLKYETGERYKLGKAGVSHERSIKTITFKYEYS